MENPLRRLRQLRCLVVRFATPCLIALAAAGSGGCASRATAPSTATASGDWSAVEALAPGSKVAVERHGGNAVSGATRTVAADSIEVDTDRSTLVVARADVSRVLRTRSRASESTARGLAIGGVGGVLQGLLLTKSNRLLFAGLFGAGWGLIGATAGAISGAGHSETTIVYSAMEANPQPNFRMQPTRRVSPGGARLIRQR